MGSRSQGEGQAAKEGIFFELKSVYAKNKLKLSIIVILYVESCLGALS